MSPQTLQCVAPNLVLRSPHILQFVTSNLDGVAPNLATANGSSLLKPCRPPIIALQPSKRRRSRDWQALRIGTVTPNLAPTGGAQSPQTLRRLRSNHSLRSTNSRLSVPCAVPRELNSLSRDLSRMLRGGDFGQEVNTNDCRRNSFALPPAVLNGGPPSVQVSAGSEEVDRSLEVAIASHRSRRLDVRRTSRQRTVSGRKQRSREAAKQ